MRFSKSKLNLTELLVVNIPLINIITLFSINFVGRDQFHLGYLRVFVFFAIIGLVIRAYGLSDRITKTIALFLLYVFVLILFSSDISYSTGVFLKVSVTMLMFPVGFFILNDFEKFHLFLKNLVYAGFLLCINYIFAQIFRIGRSAYLADSFYYGYAGIGSTVVLSYILLVTPIAIPFFTSNKDKWILRVTMFLSFLFTILVLKRIAIIALFTGFFIYLLKTGKFGTGIKIAVGIFSLLLATSPFYIDILLSRYEARTTERNELQNEQRFDDIVIALDHFQSKSFKHAIIGTEAFNSPGYFKRNRQVHVDYANILIGTGAIGFSLYMFIYFLIYKRFSLLFKFYKSMNPPKSKKEKDFLNDYKGIFFAILVASLVVSLSGGMHDITSRSMLFILFGSVIGILYKSINQSNPLDTNAFLN